MQNKESAMPVTFIFLVLLTFVVNFIPYSIFGLVMYGVSQMIWGVSTVAAYGNEADLVLKLTLLSLLIPATLFMVLQRYTVWTTVARTAKGHNYERLYPLLGKH